MLKILLTEKLTNGALVTPTPGSQHVMSKWAHFHIWAMRLTRLSYWFITACYGGREAGSNVFTCCDILGPFFCILDKSVWRWASLTLVSLLLYNKHVNIGFNLHFHMIFLMNFVGVDPNFNFSMQCCSVSYSVTLVQIKQKIRKLQPVQYVLSRLIFITEIPIPEKHFFETDTVSNYNRERIVYICLDVPCIKSQKQCWYAWVSLLCIRHCWS